MPDTVPPIESDDDDANDEGTDLQFDHAELTTPVSAGPSCAACKRPISDAYFEINGKVLCTSCRQQIEASLRGGSPAARVLKATLFGMGGALAGAALYYAILRGTGYHVGLVAVLVGFMVGGAVRKGSGGRGGLFYQFLALFLTYSSIVAFYVPLLIEEQLKHPGQPGQPAAEVAKDPQADQAKAKVEPRAIAAGENEHKPAAPAGAALPVAAAETEVRKVDRGAADQADRAADAPKSFPMLLFSLVFFLLTVLGLLYMVPISVATSSPLSGLILCFALWEAWKVTKGVKLVFNGPFRVNPAKPGTVTGEVVGDVG